MVVGSRLPLQGGLAPEESGHDLLEIGCDESGFSGTNLRDPATPVFTHASVDLTTGEAHELLDELRSGLGWPLDELKSGRLLRTPSAYDGLARFAVSLAGRAHVHVIDKEYFLVTRLVDLFVAELPWSEPTYAAGTSLTAENRPAALVLHRAGRPHAEAWEELLDSFVALVRTKRRQPAGPRDVDRLLAARDRLAALVRATATEADDVLARLDRARVEGIVERLDRDDRSLPPPLEPLLPALVETVLLWSAGGRRVLVVHDEQSALTAGRLRRLQRLLGSDGSTSPLAGLVTVDSRDDPRVQVADVLAGLARRAPASLGDVLADFVSPASLTVRG